MCVCVCKLYIYVYLYRCVCVNYIHIPAVKQAPTQDRANSKHAGTHDTMKGSKTPGKGR